jgi:hypothetical protein
MRLQLFLILSACTVGVFGRRGAPSTPPAKAPTRFLSTYPYGWGLDMDPVAEDKEVKQVKEVKRGKHLLVSTVYD